MSEAGPKLYANKPKKAQPKQFQEQLKAKDFSSPTPTQTPYASASSAAAESYRMGSQSTAPPSPQPPKESFARRYKFLWPLILTVNLTVGAYLFMRTKKKDTGLEEVGSSIPSEAVSSAPAKTTPVSGKPVSLPTVLEALKPREPIPENQQRELYKWILEEKRKVKPKDPEEKKCIDEEKAILKQIIRAKSLPSI
ncbi:hypothetical protein JCGZ_24786 [Jatropha curcas]|uniref:Uncharacterized protein n=1 Tax=Jatropha curcas TaxID=180498 RepID=A0A067KXD7_JATCU|nr:hypothetical protein JCGZ_24786 [Jatropha curcas]